jgi:serine/threonine protein kinase
MIGTVLSNRYKLIAELGSGGMAWVYLAQDLVQERQVAVKILYPQHSHDLGFVQRFNREAKLSMTLSQSSPQQNVVQVLDYGADRDTHYLVMEYVPGEDLGHLLTREGPLPLPQALDIARQVALALEHAAGVEIIHRDIKPSNIMVCPDATVKVLDFGIARARSSPHLTRSGFVGSPHYAAPEQATGQPVDTRADLYSLGVVLYRMLSGNLPFQGDTPWAVVNQHILAEPPDLAEKRPDLPISVLQLVQKAMAKRAEDRFQTPREFVEAIDAVSAGQELPFEPLSGPVTLSAPELETLYEQAQEARVAESWQQAVDLLSQIIKVDPSYADVTEQLSEVGQQIQLSNLYRAAHRALEGGQWDRALAQIERIAEIDADYKDIGDLRALATNREKPATLGASQVSEFPTQVPLRESQAESGPELTPMAEGSPSEAPISQVSTAQLPDSLHSPRRQRVLWLAASLAILILAGVAYLLFAERDLPAEISQGLPTVTISPFSEASATLLPGSRSPTRTPAAGAPSPTPNPSADLATATVLIPHSPSPLPTTRVPRTQTPTPTRTSTPSPTPTPTPTLTMSPAPGPIRPPQPKGIIAFPRFDTARGTYDVFSCSVAGTNCRRIQDQASQPDFLPDGTRLVVHSWRPDDKGLIVFTATGQRIWQITDQLEAARPSVDYLGDRYVYHSRAESDRQPRLFRTYNAETRPIVRAASTVVGQSPSWTPDGQILYSGCLINSCGIIIMRADGTFPRQIIPGGSETNPEASPNGKQIAFMSRRDGNWEVYVAGINGERVQRLTRTPSNDGLPTWSPDGLYIAFVTDRDGPWAVWAMRPDGSEQRRLFDIGGPLDGQVQNTAPYELHGWVEERISWAP